MSLEKDLMRNRAVFERLTAGGAGMQSSSPVKSEPISWESRETSPDISVPAESKAVSPEIRVFSLNTNNPARSGAVYPGNVSYPDNMIPREPPVPDNPVQALYDRLEADARRLSQPMDEEEFI